MQYSHFLIFTRINNKLCALILIGHFFSPSAMDVRVPFFNGQTSYLAYPTLVNSFAITYLRIELRPMLPTGLILFNGQANGADYIAVLLRQGRVEFWYDLGQGPATIVSNFSLTLGEWHSIEVFRTAQNGHLIVNNQFPVTGRSPGSFGMLQLSTNLFLGGNPDLNTLPRALNITSSLSGCIRELQTQFTNGYTQLISDAIDGAGITDCTGLSPCQIYGCRNGGMCIENGTDSFECVCPIETTGMFCETQICSVNNPCQNNGACYVSAGVENVADVQCNCSLPFRGQNCTESELHIYFLRENEYEL